jgi:ABC-type nitrate/sulfonate/bicarbonate transport system substrate-binding protein
MFTKCSLQVRKELAAATAEAAAMAQLKEETQKVRQELQDAQFGAVMLRSELRLTKSEADAKAARLAKAQEEITKLRKRSGERYLNKLTTLSIFILHISY